MNPSKNNFLETLRNSWFLLAAATGIIYWAAKQDSSLGDLEKHEGRIAAIEMRVSGLESGLVQLQSKIDAIKEDLTLIKSAVLK